MKKSLWTTALLLSCLALGWSAHAQDAPAAVNPCDKPRFKIITDAILCVRDHCDDPGEEKEAIYKKACIDLSGTPTRGELTGIRKQDATEPLAPITADEVAILARERGTRVEEAGDLKILSPCECLAKFEEKTHCGVVCPPPEEPKQPEVPTADTPKEVVPDAPKTAAAGSPRFEGSGCSLVAVTGFSDLGAFGILLLGPLSWAFRPRKKK
ncbi:MAG: hypothetical protein K8R69_04100 [Deltaproteobacteria bacterium]|nr:hypothetical protein [Deltaproteobacteria bacterium]